MYFLGSVAEGDPDASGSMAEPVGGGRVVLVNGRLYAFCRSAGEMSLSSAQSASAEEVGFGAAVDIFNTFEVGVGLEARGIKGGLAGLAAVLLGVLARFAFFALVIVELLLLVGLSIDEDLRFEELVGVVEEDFFSVSWSCFQFLESAVVAIVGD